MDININATIQPRPYTGEQYFEATEELPSAEGRKLAEVHTTYPPCLVNLLCTFVTNQCVL